MSAPLYPTSSTARPGWSIPAGMYPTAGEVAAAIVAGARLHGEDPIAAVTGAHGQRGRCLALAALVEAFPSASRTALGRACGFGASAEKALGNVKARRSSKWWRDADLWTARAALAAAIAETDGAPAAAPVGPEPPVDPERIARVERIKAFAAGEPIAPPKVLEAEPIEAEPIAALYDHMRKARR